MNKLKEAKQVGVLYHFTHIERLIGIIQDDFIMKSGKEVEHSHFNYISFTRDYNLQGRLEENDWFQTVRIAVDGDKLSHKYKIEPFNYWQGKDDRGSRNSATEAEERLVADKISIKDCLFSIEIMKDFAELEDIDEDTVSEVYEYGKDFNFRYVKKWTPVNKSFIESFIFKEQAIELNKAKTKIEELSDKILIETLKVLIFWNHTAVNHWFNGEVLSWLYRCLIFYRNTKSGKLSYDDYMDMLFLEPVETEDISEQSDRMRLFIYQALKDENGISAVPLFDSSIDDSKVLRIYESLKRFYSDVIIYGIKQKTELDSDMVWGMLENCYESVKRAIHGNFMETYLKESKMR